MARKTKEELAAAKAAKVAAEAEALRLARPFAFESTDPYGARDDDGKRAVAEEIAAAKASGASGDEMRERFGERLSGPARRKVLRAHGFDGTAYVARSYGSYRDGEARVGTRHAREHGAAAASRRAEALAEAEAEAEAARKSAKGRTKAARAAYETRVAEAEARVAALR